MNKENKNWRKKLKAIYEIMVQHNSYRKGCPYLWDKDRIDCPIFACMYDSNSHQRYIENNFPELKNFCPICREYHRKYDERFKVK